jgi:hypothetical protein
MDIVDSHPETGIRVVLKWLSEMGGPPWVYEGVASTPKTDYRMRAFVEVDLSVRIETREGMPTTLAIKVQTMVRSACARAAQDGVLEPLEHIQGWRTSGSW